MKLSEYKNEDALDLLAEIIEPASKICSDPVIKAVFTGESKTAKVVVVKHLLKEHKPEIIEILAAFDGVPVSEYSGNILTMTASVMTLLNDKDVINFFTLQGQM